MLTDGAAVGLVLCTGGLLGGLYFGAARLSRARHIQNTPTARIRSAAQGYVELEGRARMMPGEKIYAPLTLTPCVWWHFEIFRKQSSHNKRAQWTCINRSSSDDLFLLEDSTGSCIVDADGATVTPGAQYTWYGNSPRPDLGPKAGTGLLRAVFCEYRYHEAFIVAGEPLYAMGWFRSEGNRTDPQDESVSMRELLAEWKRDALKMKVFDTNKDGRIDVTEWEAVRRMALKKVRQQVLEQATDPDFHILRQPPDGREYLLSGISQADLVSRAQLQSGLGFTVAIVSAIVLAKLLALA